jgi:hypothetical protein
LPGYRKTDSERGNPSRRLSSLGELIQVVGEVVGNEERRLGPFDIVVEPVYGESARASIPEKGFYKNERHEDE